jgi:hypothetical protein
MSKERKTAVVITAAVSIALAVGAYLYFSGKEYVIRISESDIQRKLEEKTAAHENLFADFPSHPGKSQSAS